MQCIATIKSAKRCPLNPQTVQVRAGAAPGGGEPQPQQLRGEGAAGEEAALHGE